MKTGVGTLLEFARQKEGRGGGGGLIRQTKGGGGGGSDLPNKMGGGDLPSKMDGVHGFFCELSFLWGEVHE